MSADLHYLITRKNIGKAKSLLHSLVPRAQSFCYYDTEGECIWSSDGAEDHELDNYIAGLSAEAFTEKTPEGLRRTLPSGRTLLALPVHAENNTSLGLLVSIFSGNTGMSSSFNPDFVAKILEPAVDVIGDGLRLSRQLDAVGDRIRKVEKELSLVYDVDERIHGLSNSHAGLAQLVGQGGRFLGITYSVLLIPSKRIRISATHSSWKHVNRQVLDRYVIDHLMPKLDDSRWPTVFEIPGIEGSENASERGFFTLLSPIIDQYGKTEGVIAQLGRIEEKPFSKSERRFMSHIARRAEYVIERSFDSMTGQMNRSGFEAQLQESEKELKDQDDQHQIIYFDLDNLQLINDTFGRDAGDAVIKRFAQLLQDGLPRSAVVSRLTGDDFCILLTHADTDKAIALAEDVKLRLRELRYLEGDKSLQITMSVGIADFNARSGADGRALTSARMACEAAKDHGRDRIEVYDDKDQSIIRRHDNMQLVSQIQQNLDANAFELYAQPITCLNGRDDRPHFEILLRMSDSDGNQIPTGAFFSAAERYQLMPQIDRWVVSMTIAKLSQHESIREGKGAIFSVNLSGQSLGDDGILEFIKLELEQSGLNPSSLCFEITESAAVSNLKNAQAFIDVLRDMGCRISLDDFGAGLSSFAYLKNFNVDTLKIDGSFIRDITENRISESMVAAITQVAKVMHLDTVAEYVETDEARKLVTELGVDYGQGHGIRRPFPLVEALAELSVDALPSTA